MENHKSKASTDQIHSPNNGNICPLCTSEKITSFAQREIVPVGIRHFLQCSICKLIFLDNDEHLDLSEEKKRYDLHQNDPTDPEYRSFLKRLTDEMLPYIKSQSYGLDFGCGPGPTIEHILALNGHKIANFDPFYYPDTDLLNDSYDFITCTEVAEHLRNPSLEFARFKKMVKPKGVLGIMTLMYHEDIDFIKWWYPTDPAHICFYQIETFKWIANWLNWEVVFPRDNVAIYTNTNNNLVE